MVGKRTVRPSIYVQGHQLQGPQQTDGAATVQTHIEVLPVDHQRQSLTVRTKING